jgi:multidrug efflux pump subunit AcrA (membrane-fusion protein)
MSIFSRASPRRVIEMLDATASIYVARSLVVLVMAEFLLANCGHSPETNASRQSTNSPETQQSVELSPSQLSAIKLQQVETHEFYLEKEGVGNIDFDNKLYFENSLSVQVFPPRQGKISKTLAELGDQVQKGQPLYTLGSSDMPVRSPITGQVTSVNASPGAEVGPGRAPAPYAVADVSTKWIVGTVLESDSPLFQIDQPVEVKAIAYPGRIFEGKIIKIYPTVDGNTHRVMIRSQVFDPKNELRSGMLAEFVVRVQEPTEGLAIPANSIVREGDGLMTTWVTADRHHFSQRIVKTGLREDDHVQIVDGLKRGELVVTEGAVFLSNMLQAPPSD